MTKETREFLQRKHRRQLEEKRQRDNIDTVCKEIKETLEAVNLMLIAARKEREKGNGRVDKH